MTPIELLVGIYTLLSLIDEPVRLLKRRPILHTLLKRRPILHTGSFSVSSRIQKGHGATYHLGAPYHERRAPS